MIERNFSYQVTSSVDAFFEKDFNFNPFIASGAIGMCIDEFNGDNFDHSKLGFVGGGYIGAAMTNGRPILSTRTPKGTPTATERPQCFPRVGEVRDLKPGILEPLDEDGAHEMIVIYEYHSQW